MRTTPSRFCALSVVFLLVLTAVGRAAAADQSWKQAIAALEKAVFDPVLSADEADRLLAELKTPDKRAAAARRLCEQGQGHVERIVLFAHDCSDIEAREACADVVEAIDSSFCTTERGRQLGVLYRAHAAELLPAYWAMFRKAPLDRRAVAMLMSGDPEIIYGLLMKSRDRHDTARFLLLRIRELSPDEFAADRLRNHSGTGFLLVLSDVFPFGACNLDQQVYFGAARVVGHTYLHVVQLRLSEPLQPTRNGGRVRRAPTKNTSPQSPRSAQDRLRQAGTAGPQMNSKPVWNNVPPDIQQLELIRRLVGICDTSFGKLCFLAVDSDSYIHESYPGVTGRMDRMGRMDRLEQRGIVPLHLQTNEGLCALPKVNIQQSSRLPWYAKPYVPAAYQSRIRFQKQPPGERPPSVAPAQYGETSALLGRRAVRPAAPLDASAPAVVILPPRLPEAADGSVRAEADLLCDRLAEEIAAEGIARVLDRSQLDRVLEEKRLSGDFSKPAIAYDALVRLDVDVPSLVPEVRMSVIDLSRGNVMKESRCDWPMREDDLRRLVGQCREGLKLAGHADKGKLKVRCLEAANEERNPRLKPLIGRLERVFQEAVARSPQLTPVRHLEAASAKEESLLLLMGLSRLPGGRRFVPQADATVELSVREGDGRGKTFEETPVEIAARVTRGDAGGDRSFTTVATVAEFDKAAVKTWEKLAGLLREAKPNAATDWLDDLAVRRRQAEAELRAAKAIDPGYSRTAEHDRAIHARLAHVEAAVKLDPTLEDAAGDNLRMLMDECVLAQQNWLRQKVNDLAEEILAQALRYLERFGPRGKYRKVALDAGCAAAAASLADLESSTGMELTPQRLRIVQMAKLILEDAVKFGPPIDSAMYLNVPMSQCSRAAILTIVGRAMKRTRVPAAERQQWVDGILRQAALSEEPLPNMDPAELRSLRNEKERDEAQKAALLRQFECDRFRWECTSMILCAAELAMDDVCIDRAWKLAAQLENRYQAKDKYALMGAFSMQQELLPRLRFVVMRMDDAGRLAEFDRWLDGLTTRTKLIEMIRIRWPIADLYGDTTAVPGAIRHNDIPTFDGLVIQCPTSPPSNLPRVICPLVEGNGRLYITMSGNFIKKYNNRKLSTYSDEIGYLTLDKAGRPVGKTYRLKPKATKPHFHPQEDKKEYWDGLKTLPQLQLGKPLRVNDSKYVAGKLCLATGQCGLVIFDEKSEKWSVYGAEQGLPDENVSVIYPLDERTLFCVAKASSEFICYTLDISNGKVTLFNRKKIEAKEPIPMLFWRSGDTIMAWSRAGLYEDLLGPTIKFTRRDCGTPYGWNALEGRIGYPTMNNTQGFTSLAETGGRRFVTYGGVHEFDSSGRIIRSWWRDCSYGNYDNYPANIQIEFPPSCPVGGDEALVMGSLLVFGGSRMGGLVVWDSINDIWYGPLAPPNRKNPYNVMHYGAHAANRAGLWLVSRNMLFVAADDFLEAARKAGRVITTAEYRRRQREIVAAMPLLDQAKFAISIREFDTAEDLLNRVLASDDACAEALLLLGIMNEPCCANRPEKALKYYRRLAGMASNPRASCTGMFQRLVLLRNLKRWPEAMDTINDINRTFSGRLGSGLQSLLDRLSKETPK